MLTQLYVIFRALDEQIAWFDREVQKVFRSSETCRRLAKIRGVSPKTATAIVATVGDGAEFTMVGISLRGWVSCPVSIRVAIGSDSSASPSPETVIWGPC
jgi:hypothetical protein